MHKNSLLVVGSAQTARATSCLLLLLTCAGASLVVPVGPRSALRGGAQSDAPGELFDEWLALAGAGSLEKITNATDILSGFLCACHMDSARDRDRERERERKRERKRDLYIYMHTHIYIDRYV